MLHPLVAIGFAAFLYVTSQVIAAVVLFAVLHLIGWNSEDIQVWLSEATLAQFFYILIVEALTIAGVVWVLRRRGLTMRSIGWDRFKPRYIWLSLTGYGVYFLLFIIIAILTSILIPSLDFEQEQQLGFDQSQTTIGLVLVFISLVILPPLTEEIVFRGLIFTSLRKKLPFFTTTILTSILFAIPHLQFGSSAPLLWVAALDTLVLSFVLCYVREKTSSLWPAISIHALKNGIAFVGLFLVTNSLG